MSLSGEFDIETFKEGNRFEAKLSKVGLPDSIWETYSSFANTDGGLILLGIKENNDGTFTIEGLENPEKIEKAFWDGVNNKKVVNINILNNSNVEIKEIDGKHILAVTVPRAERIYRPVFKGTDMFSGTYRRNGEGDYCCSRDEVASIFRDAGQLSQDNKIITEVSLDSLCKETITHYRQRFVLIHSGHVWNSLSDVDFLKKIGAAKINSEDGKVYPTAAGLLMFGYESEILYEYPQYFLDYQEHFDETTRWSDRFVSSSGEWSGNIFDFFFKVFNKLTEDIKRPFSMNGITRIDDTPVHKAIREILVNTLVNADYYGRCGVVVKKYRDYFSFENPGVFRISLKEAIDGGMSDPRNATILKMFSMIDIGERAGSGIPGVFSVWNDEFGIVPEYEQIFLPERTTTVLKFSENIFEIDVQENVHDVQEKNQNVQENVHEKLQDVQEKDRKNLIFELILQNPEITLKELSEKLKVASKTVQRDLEQLKKEGVIERIGSDRKGQWKALKV